MRKVPKRKLFLGKMSRFDFVKKQSAVRNDNVDSMEEFQDYISPKRHISKWKMELWANAPLKAESINAQEAYIRQIEQNVDFLLKINKVTRSAFTKWMRQNRVTASRYLFKNRKNGYSPYVTIVDMIMIARFFNISMEKIVFSDLQAGMNKQP
jgi:hypothetical protein